MLPRSTVHTHTNFSDATNTVEEMVRAALDRNFISLGFSDHGACFYDAAGMRDEAGYRAEVRRVQKKYAGQIEIALGYEHDSFAEGADLSHYDYVIESVHFLRKEDVYIPIDLSPSQLQSGIDQLYGGNPYVMVRDYYDSVNRSMIEVKPDIVGHIGLITKFNEQNPILDCQSKKYLYCAKETIAIAAQRDILVEINTGAMSRGYRTEPYPQMELLRLLKSLNGRITITSDCHRAEWIDFAFDQAIEYAKAAGFREAYVWEKGGFAAKEL